MGYRPSFADFNGDGIADVFWGQVDSNGLSTGSRVLWLGKGDGTFTVVSNFGGQDGTLAGYYRSLPTPTATAKPMCCGTSARAPIRALKGSVCCG